MDLIAFVGLSSCPKCGLWLAHKSEHSRFDNAVAMKFSETMGYDADLVHTRLCNGQPRNVSLPTPRTIVCGGPKIEHLHRSCRGCGFKWIEHTRSGMLSLGPAEIGRAEEAAKSL